MLSERETGKTKTRDGHGRPEKRKLETIMQQYEETDPYSVQPYLKSTQTVAFVVEIEGRNQRNNSSKNSVGYMKKKRKKSVHKARSEAKCDQITEINILKKNSYTWTLQLDWLAIYYIFRKDTYKPELILGNDLAISLLLHNVCCVA